MVHSTFSSALFLCQEQKWPDKVVLYRLNGFLLTRSCKSCKDGRFKPGTVGLIDILGWVVKAKILPRSLVTLMGIFTVHAYLAVNTKLFRTGSLNKPSNSSFRFKSLSEASGTSTLKSTEWFKAAIVRGNILRLKSSTNLFQWLGRTYGRPMSTRSNMTKS